MRDSNADSTGQPALPSQAGVVVVTCAVLELEIEAFRQAHPGVVHVELMEQGLHNDPPRLRTELQAKIDRLECQLSQARAIVLGYGICSRGTEGVRTSRCRLVIPRAHDCITLLLGSKERYAKYVADHPGTYWYSPGWNKHHIPPGKQRYEKLLSKYTEQFGEEDAKYLMEQEQHWFSTYNQATYVDLTVGATDADLAYTRQCADWLKWDFDRQAGDPALLHDLLDGQWDPQRFLVLEPGETYRITADDRVIEKA